MERLAVWAERLEGFVRVGSLRFEHDAGEWFEHDESYLRRGDSWLIPMGLEPTTHILKASSSSFPDQMLNEAICMRCARACGFDDAAETSLVVVDNNKVLLVSKRFNRTETRERPAGLPGVMRLHQADFCQIMGVSVDGLKYTPSDELVDGYNTSLAVTISRESSERYGDRSYVFDA